MYETFVTRKKPSNYIVNLRVIDLVCPSKNRSTTSLQTKRSNIKQHSCFDWFTLSQTESGNPKYNIFLFSVLFYCLKCFWLSIMGSESAMVVCCIICLLLPSVVLQSCGFFSPYWIKHNSTTECFRGVVYNMGCPDNVEGRYI